MSKYKLKNTTSGYIFINTWMIGPYISELFYDSFAKTCLHTSDMQNSLMHDAAGINAMLANGSLVFTIDDIVKNRQDFYDFWSTYVGYIVGPSSDTLLPGNIDPLAPIVTPLYTSSTAAMNLSNSTVTVPLFPTYTSMSVSGQTPGNITVMQADGLISFTSLSDYVSMSIMLGTTDLFSFFVHGTDLIGASTATNYHWKLDARVGAQTSPSSGATVVVYGSFCITTPSGVKTIDIANTAYANTNQSNSLNLWAQWNNASTSNVLATNIANVFQQTLYGTVLAVPGQTTQYVSRTTTGNTILSSDYCLRYVGLTDVYFVLPKATGSKRYLKLIHAGAGTALMYVGVTDSDTVSNDTSIWIQKLSDQEIVVVELVDDTQGQWIIVG